MEISVWFNKQSHKQTDQHLDDHVRILLQQTPGIGLSLERGALRGQGLNIQRERVRQSMNRIDPVSRTIRNIEFIVRRTYNVRSPNSLWYVLCITKTVCMIYLSRVGKVFSYLN